MQLIKRDFKYFLATHPETLFLLYTIEIDEKTVYSHPPGNFFHHAGV